MLGIRNTCGLLYFFLNAHPAAIVWTSHIGDVHWSTGKFNLGSSSTLKELKQLRGLPAQLGFAFVANRLALVQVAAYHNHGLSFAIELWLSTSKIYSAK